MADQGVRYVVTLQDVNVTSGLKAMDSSATSAERSVSALNDTLRTMAGAFGVGFGLHALVDFGKDAVQGAADYETAIKRIKFASADFADGAKNISFINSEVDKFKIPLQDATDAYGKFLAMVKGSGLAGDQIRTLHDQLLLISKVKGLGDGQLNASVMNLGKMLEAGTLDARHFRPLEQQLSGIGKYVADEMGITLNQLAILRNKGKLTGVDPSVLLRAIARQAKELEQFLPESTNTIQSGINEVSNAWLRFKNDLVFDNRKELISLFDTLKEGITWLREHEKDIITFGKTVMTIGKYWLEYKIAMAAVNTVQATYSGFMNGFLGKTVAQTTAYEAQALAINSVTAAIERLNFVTNATNGSFITNAAGATMANTAGNRYMMTAGGAAAAGEGAAIGELAGVSVIGGALLVALTAASAVAIAVAMHDDKAVYKIKGGEYGHRDNLAFAPTSDTLGYTFGHSDSSKNPFSQNDTLYNIKKGFKSFYDTVSNVGGNLDWDRLIKSSKSIEDSTHPAKHKGSYNISPATDRISGNRPISYYITIKELNGMNHTTITEGTSFDSKKVAMVLRDEIVGIVNDAQIRAGN